MRLRRLELDQVRKFDRPVRIEGFRGGLNLLAGPNEMGKSTVLAALQAVLFERYRAGGEQVRALCPDGSRAAPRIALDFELDGQPYRIEKRFLLSPSARLILPDGARFEDDEAEDELQRQLGFGPPANRGPTVDSLGSWGVLWVAQGSSFEQAGLASRTRSDLNACLVAEVDALVGTEEARRLRARFEGELFELIERRGEDRPKGAYRRSLEALSVAQAKLQTLIEHQARLDGDLRELAAIGQELGELEDLREDGRLAGERDAARARLDAARDRTARIQSEESDLRLRLQEHATLAKLMRERALRRDRIDGLVGEIEATHDLLGPLLAEIEARGATLADQRAELARLEGAESSLRRRIRAAGVRDRRNRKQNELSALHSRRREVEAGRAEALELAAKAQAILIERSDLDRIQRRALDLERAEAERLALGTRVRFDLEPAALARVRVGGRPLDMAKTTIETDEPLAVEIEGLGVLEITPAPGRQPVASRALELRGELAELLARVGAADPESAARLLGRKQRLLDEVRRQEERSLLLVETAVPGATSLAGLEERIAALEGDVEGEPVLDEQETGAVQALEVELDAQLERIVPVRCELERRVIGRDALLERHTRGVESLRLRGEDLARLQAELDAELETESDPDLGRRLDEATREAAIARETVEHLREQAARAPVELVEADLARIEGQIRSRGARREQLRIEASGLAAGIARGEGEGLSEAIAALERRCARLEAERTAHARQVKMLKLLIESLDEAGQAAREHYFKPLLARLHPHLQALFPGAEVRVDDEGRITAITRDGSGDESFDRLSDGTREQIAILARLALAELLADHGRPAMVVLDDALVFADEVRLQRMFEVLEQASRKVQILVLTCRERAFEGLAANRIALTPIAAAEAA